MRAVRNRFASRALALLLGAACSLPLGAQSPWESSRNVAGLSGPEGARADVSLYSKYTWGNFRSPSMGKTLFSSGVSAAAVTQYKDLVLVGNFGFDLTEGEGMMGSMFTHPGYYPIDILEFTPGHKTRQTYDVGGGLAWKNGSRWIPGGTVRFQGINYAKRQDLRHLTYRQELEVAPSVLYQGDGFRLGASYLFGKNSEFIKADQIGSATADSYYAFLDKGIRYGTMQIWDGNGTHLNDTGLDRLAVKEYSHGLSLQGSWGKALYGDAEYRYSRGLVGEKGYNWYRFPGHQVAVRLMGSIPVAAGVHALRGAVDWNRQENYEYTVITENHNGVSTPVEHGCNRVFSRATLKGTLGYRFTHRDGWWAGSQLVLTHNKDLSTLMYPFLDKDESHTLLCRFQGHVPLGPLELTAGLLAGCKVGEHRHVVENAEPSLGIQEAPCRLQDWWDREQEANDATRVGLSVRLRYNFRPGSRFPLYVEASGNWLHAFDIELLSGCNRQTAQISLGYYY